MLCQLRIFEFFRLFSVWWWACINLCYFLYHVHINKTLLLKTFFLKIWLLLKIDFRFHFFMFNYGLYKLFKMFFKNRNRIHYSLLLTRFYPLLVFALLFYVSRLFFISFLLKYKLITWALHFSIIFQRFSLIS